MKSFTLTRADSYASAQKALSSGTYSLPILKAGGIDVVDHLKEGLWQPDLVVDIRAIKRGISATDGGLRVEAATTLAELAASKEISQRAPVVTQAIAGAATPAVRNAATAAGNLLQRPRCWYYRSEQFECLKKGGATCFSVDGENKYHAIFGEGPCHIVHPSNLAPALMVTNGVVHVTGGKRNSIPIGELFHMPDKGVRTEHNLEDHEVVTHMTFDASPHSGFYGVKEKQSFDWPLAFACVSLDMDGDTIKSARVCAGAVAPVPWMLPNVAQALAGVKATDDAAIMKAAALSTQGAKPMSDNAYKLRLLPVVVARATVRALGREVEGLS